MYVVRGDIIVRAARTVNARKMLWKSPSDATVIKPLLRKRSRELWLVRPDVRRMRRVRVTATRTFSTSNRRRVLVSTVRDTP